MKKIIYYVFLATIFACSVKTYQKPNQTFEDFKSWCWLQGCEVTYQGPDYLYDQRTVDEIANAIAYNMHQKGYQQGDDQSDLMINFFMIINEDSTEVHELYEGTYQGEREWLSMLYPEYQKFLKGSLTIDVIDRKNSELVWRSTSIKYMELNPHFDKKEIWSDIEKAMKKLPECYFEVPL